MAALFGVLSVRPEIVVGRRKHDSAVDFQQSLPVRFFNSTGTP
jgi:hypothetical protein